MKNELFYKKIEQLLKETKNEPFNLYLAFPEWFIGEFKNYFNLKNNKVYFQGIEVLVYPNKFEG